ncbi:MAG: hypothetical protein GX639_00800 [Fibrobacter sp.]|nr:hypothetical protein [Fibrobacter sp.]
MNNQQKVVVILIIIAVIAIVISGIGVSVNSSKSTFSSHETFEPDSFPLFKKVNKYLGPFGPKVKAEDIQIKSNFSCIIKKTDKKDTFRKLTICIIPRIKTDTVGRVQFIYHNTAERKSDTCILSVKNTKTEPDTTNFMIGRDGGSITISKLTGNPKACIINKNHTFTLQ